MRKPLGCLSVSGFLTALLVVIVISGFVWIGGGTIFSPGPLNAQVGAQALGGVNSHAGLSRRCEACHTPFWGQEVMSDRCLVCHTPVAQELESRAGLHGTLWRSGPQPCQTCHTEHKGATTALTVMNLTQFPHAETTGYALTGHARLSNGQPFTCADCHRDNFNSFDRQSCTTCHQEIDPVFSQAHLVMFGPACLDCHDGQDTYGAAFDHSQTAFPLAGAHAAANCAACHQGQQTRQGLQATPSDCYTCHLTDDTHNGRFGPDCATCHTATSWKDATFDHNRTAFPLTGAHVSASCQSCHVNNVYQGTPQDCYACHRQDDAHNGRFGSDCAACHTTTRWEEATFDHNRTAFPLTGAHVSASCEECHANNVYQGTPQDCYACHRQDDEHDGQQTDCGRCHSTSTWDDAEGDEGEGGDD